MDDREGQRHWRVGNVGAADVESPGDCIGLGQHMRIGLALFEAFGDCLQLVVYALPCKLQWLGLNRFGW
jgi:hypothetical protein